MRPIRAIERDMAGGILKTGQPAGLWLCRIVYGYVGDALPKRFLWTGIDADGERAEAVHGCFRDVIEWLSVRQGTFPADGKVRVRRPAENSSFAGIRVTEKGAEKIGDVKRAEVYAGFAYTYYGTKRRRLREEQEGGVFL